MKYQILIIVLISLITGSFQLLKRTEKSESKTEVKNDKEFLEVKETITNLNANNIDNKEVKLNKTQKEKVKIFILIERKV